MTLTNKTNAESTATDPGDDTSRADYYEYQNGFGNVLESETIPGTLPQGRNNPKTISLYTEQLSGSAFTQPRNLNLHTWLYRTQPSVVHNAQNPFQYGDFFGGGEDPTQGVLDPNAMRWSPFLSDDDASSSHTFATGMHLLGSSGDPTTKSGLAIYVYLCRQDMKDSYMYNSDGDFLIVPQEGTLDVSTELGRLSVKPREIAVIPRGIVFSVNGNGRGYVLEIYKGHFVLPELGPIGSNGLANARDVQYPVAWTEAPFSKGTPATLYNKFGSRLWHKSITTTPFNVVAWHGNYLPFKYDLKNFCAVNSVTYDHLDPSIYTVLTCAGDEPGTALCDFVIFPPRWMSTDSNTFRPPWFHRNTMTEFMGLIQGGYDAKKGFEAGGASLHSCMTPHGPDAVTYDKAVADPCDKPTYFSGGLAFMFETSHMLRLSKYALDHACRDVDYSKCWEQLPDRFSSEQDSKK